MAFHDQAVGPGGDRRAGKRRDHIQPSRRMGGVDHDRQMGFTPGRNDRAEIERIAG